MGISEGLRPSTLITGVANTVLRPFCDCEFTSAATTMKASASWYTIYEIDPASIEEITRGTFCGETHHLGHITCYEEQLR